MQFMKFKNYSAHAALATAIIGSLVAGEVSAATLCVNPGGTFPCKATIQAAVTAASPGDIIEVAPGTYVGNVNINKEDISLQGAQYGVPFQDRTFDSVDESTVDGVIRIQAAGVELDGFSLTAPAVVNDSAFSVIVETAGDDAMIAHNLIQEIIATGVGLSAAQAIYLENGPDGVSILDNAISTVSGVQSTKGIFIGDSTSSNPSEDIVIEGNSITDIFSSTGGAYGILVNNGASVAPAATGYTEVEILDNVIDYLEGNWAHAIGLEGDTPLAIVESNIISDLVDTSGLDEVAVFFEANIYFADALVNLNSFDPVTVGIFVHPALMGGSLDGTCNWWGAPDGPAPDGSGAFVGPNVDFTPWLTAPGGPCNGDPADSVDDCKKGGWQSHSRIDGSSFKNQGACMKYVNTGK